MSDVSLRLEDLLAPVSLEAFFRESWEKTPLTVARDAPGSYAGLFSLRDVDSVLAFSRPKFTDPAAFAARPPSPATYVRGVLADQPPMLAASVVAAFAAPALAAEKMMIPEEGTIEILLLRQKSVAKELKISDAEHKKIHDYAKEQWKKAQDAVALSQKEQDDKFAAIAKENERFLEQTLTKEQQKRLHEITLQMAGLLYATRPDIAANLKLTDQQKQSLKKYQEEARRELEQALEAKDATERHKKLSELHKTNRDRLYEVLTDPQEATWKQMTGAKFNGELEYSSQTTNK